MSIRLDHSCAIAGCLILAGLAAGCTPVDNRTANRAEDACLDAAHDDGYRNVRATSSATGIGDTVMLSLTGNRNDRSYDGSCTYDRQRRRASISWQRGDGGSGNYAQARAACEREAQDRNFKVRNIDQGSRSGNAVVFDMQLRRSGDNYTGQCWYNNGRANLQTDRQ